MIIFYLTYVSLMLFKLKSNQKIFLIDYFTSPSAAEVFTGRQTGHFTTKGSVMLLTCDMYLDIEPRTLVQTASEQHRLPS